MMNNAGESGTADRRRHGWTLWREIYGTVIGTLPFVIAVFLWASNVNQRLSVVELEIAHAKQMMDADRANAREDRQDVGRKLDRITVQIETVQQSIARVVGATGNGR